MLNALNTAATGMAAQSKQIDVISNNIANADTTSFKKTRAEFADLLYNNSLDPGAATSATTKSPTGIQVGAGVKITGTGRDHRDGSLKPTGNELDFAISGSGFFSVQGPDGELAYTRDGSFKLDTERKLVNASGLALVPEITVPPEVQSISISPDGRVQGKIGPNERQDLGQIQLTTFANDAGLQQVGGNIYSETPASGTPNAGSPGEAGAGMIQQYYLESSNVQPVQEMTDMVRAQRVFELNSKVVTTTDQMMQTLNQVR